MILIKCLASIHPMGSCCCSSQQPAKCYPPSNPGIQIESLRGSLQFPCSLQKKYPHVDFVSLLQPFFGRPRAVRKLELLGRRWPKNQTSGIKWWAPNVAWRQRDAWKSSRSLVSVNSVLVQSLVQTAKVCMPRFPPRTYLARRNSL